MKANASAKYPVSGGKQPASWSDKPWPLPVFWAGLLLGIIVLSTGSDGLHLWPWLALAVVALGILSLVPNDPQWLFVAMISILPITRFPVVHAHLETLKIMLYLVLLAWLFIRRSQAMRQVVMENPWNAYFALFTLWLAANAIDSTQVRISWTAWLGHVTAFGAFYSFGVLAHDRRLAKWSLAAFIGTGIGVAALAIAQYGAGQFRGLDRWAPYLFFSELQFRQWVLHAPKEFAVGGFRSVGTFYHANLLGIYLSLVYPLALAGAVGLRRPLKKSVLVAGTLILAGGVFASGSRGAFLSLVFSTLTIVVVLWPEIKAQHPGMILTGLLVAVPGLSTAALSWFRLEQGFSFRDVLWGNGLDIASQYAWLGCGLGTFYLNYLPRFGFPSQMDFDLSFGKVLLSGTERDLLGLHAHNAYLNYAAETGMAGMALMVFFYLLYFILFFRGIARLSDRPDWERWMVAGCGAAILGNAIHGFFDTTTNFYDLSIALAFVFLAGLSQELLRKCAA